LTPDTPKKKPKSDQLKMEESCAEFLEWRRQQVDLSGIVLPMSPNMANARRMWRVTNKLRSGYFHFLEDLMRQGLLPEPPFMPPEKAIIRVKMYVKKEHDFDNAVSRCKWPCDFLVNAGYLLDDRPKNMVWHGMPEQEVLYQQVPRIQIWIEALEYENEQDAVVK
jgi:hypothetical protein